jgi:hypothetical protein
MNMDILKTSICRQQVTIIFDIHTNIFKKIKTSESLIIVLQAIEKDCQVPTTNLCNLMVPLIITIVVIKHDVQS